jgi:PTH1 family peptidyl-tRNA hydrolase
VEVVELVVVHDELDLDLGTVRVKVGGGHGGHNGLRSIIEQLGKADFLRVRVGIGKPPGTTQEKDVSGYVLSDFPSAIAGEVDDLVRRSADAVEAIVGLGATQAMNRFNRSTKLATAAQTRPEEFNVRPRKEPEPDAEAPRSPQVGGLQTRED